MIVIVSRTRITITITIDYYSCKESISKVVQWIALCFVMQSVASSLFETIFLVRPYHMWSNDADHAAVLIDQVQDDFF